MKKLLIVNLFYITVVLLLLASFSLHNYAAGPPSEFCLQTSGSWNIGLNDFITGTSLKSVDSLTSQGEALSLKVLHVGAPPSTEQWEVTVKRKDDQNWSDNLKLEIAWTSVVEGNGSIDQDASESLEKNTYKTVTGKQEFLFKGTGFPLKISIKLKLTAQGEGFSLSKLSETISTKVYYKISPQSK